MRREITLSFTIESNSQSDYQANEEQLSLMSCIKVWLIFRIPANSSEVYHLIYTGNQCHLRTEFRPNFRKNFSQV